MSWTIYESNPWEGIDTNKRDWYVPALREWYIRNSTYSRFVTAQFNNGSVRAETMHITKLIPPHANFNELSLRQIWLPSSYIDSTAREITFNHYGGKMSLHEYDDLITYWQQNGERPGLVNIINNGLGAMMSRTMNLLARNAFLQNSIALYGHGATSIGAVQSSHTMTTELLHDIHLGMEEREVPFTRNSDGSAPFGQIFCITSPGVIRDLRNEVSSQSKGLEFVNAMSYANAAQLVSGEIGSYAGVRFIKSNDAILYNMGATEHQTTVTAAINMGDGAPDPASTKVDSVFKVGQPGAQVTHYITVADASGFDVGDRVSLHVTRTSAYGVTNGPSFMDGKKMDLRIVAIDGNNISFDQPVMEDFTVDLGGGVYGYVTKGRHIHSALFVGGSDGVAMGVAAPPSVHVPMPIDDLGAIYRVSWSGRFGYQIFEPHVFEPVFLAGSNRFSGARYVS